MENWADSAVTLRSRFMVRPLAQWDVRREFLRRLKKAFDSEGIEIPPSAPHRVCGSAQGWDCATVPFGHRRRAGSDSQRFLTGGARRYAQATVISNRLLIVAVLLCASGLGSAPALAQDCGARRGRCPSARISNR